jgi:hypothetical protein
MIEKASWACAVWSRGVVVLAVVLGASTARAQMAPMGDHYAGRPSDTGHEGLVNAVGAYTTSVPLDLPPTRDGLAVPVQIVSGEYGVGAAGAGWDVPLTYVRRDMSFAGRRPQDVTGAAPVGRERVTLSMQGRTMELVRKGQGWIPRSDAPTLSLTEQSNTWTMFDGEGRTYLFTQPAVLAATGLWLLRSVGGPGGTMMQLDYDVGFVSVGAGIARTIDLVRVSYNISATLGCAKNEIALAYGASVPGAPPLSIAVMGGDVLMRARIRWRAWG